MQRMNAKYKQNNEPDCFREQMPEWEPALRAGDCQIITYSKDDWKNAPASFNGHSLEILGQSVMEDWETPYMRELASIATHHGGHILEIGFGMGISSRFIQEAPIEEHIIIEANYEVAQAARSFACNARHPVSVLEGLWEEVIDLVPDGSISGILFDSYPLVEEELYQNHFSFFPYAYKKLQGGGVLTYYSDEVESFSDIHLKKLLKAGFSRENITGKVVTVDPPKGCIYWKAKTILAPKVVK